MNLVDCAKFARLMGCLQPLGGRGKPILHHTKHKSIGTLSLHGKGLYVSRDQSEGLLNHHVAAGTNGLHRQRDVGTVGGANRHNVYSMMCQKLRQRAVARNRQRHRH